MKNLIKISPYFILSLMLSLNINAQSDSKVAEQDSLALVAFYYAMDGPNWTSNQDGFGIDDLTSEWQGIYDGGFNKWLEGPVKDWFGVKVEQRQITNSTDYANRVTWVWPVVGRRTDGQNFLKGTLPREVGLLTALERFYVNGNNGLAWTEIPDDLYHSSLTHLDIESANFGGEITDAFRSCVNIRKMNFRYNYIDYMPTLDFLDADGLYALEGTQWFYSTRLSFAIAEKNVDHFYTVSDNPKEFGVEYRDCYDVGDEQEVVAAEGSAVELECMAAGEQEGRITYQWYKNGLSMFGKKSRTLSISSVSASDYADYTVKIENEYVKEYDANSNYGEVYTKPIHLVDAPVNPKLEWAHSSYNGKEISLRFSKPMDADAAGFEGFAIQAGSRSLTATAAKTNGRLNEDIVITLSEPLLAGELITIDYSGAAVIDYNGGVLAAFSDSSVVNFVRESPVLLSASTTKDGNGIKLVFDNYIDENSLNVDDFVVNRVGNGDVSFATLFAGDLDEKISKTVLLTLAEPIVDNTEEMTVSYVKGELSGLYSGVVESAGPIDVANEVSLQFTEVLFTFTDGSKQLEDVVLQGSWRLSPLQMYDDGTHGDDVASDNIWAASVNMVADSYTWDVLSRTTSISFDTVSVTDPETGIITQTITPTEIVKDSLLSETVLLEFLVQTDQYSGRTSFGIQNIPVTFMLTVDVASDELFLMGIDDDWGLGIPMIATENALEYSATIPAYTVGDLIEYNYRDGDYWENRTVEPRSYVVIDGDNIVENHFGSFIGMNVMDEERYVEIYPNPVRDILYLKGISNLEIIEVFSISGQLMYSGICISDETREIDVSTFESGIYLLKLRTKQSTVLIEKIIKY